MKDIDGIEIWQKNVDNSEAIKRAEEFFKDWVFETIKLGDSEIDFTKQYMNVIEED